MTHEYQDRFRDAEDVSTRFEAVGGKGSSWSVIDHFTHESVVVKGIAMDGLSENLAHKLTDVLNEAPDLIGAPAKH